VEGKSEKKRKRICDEIFPVPFFFSPPAEAAAEAKAAQPRAKAANIFVKKSPNLEKKHPAGQ